MSQYRRNRALSGFVRGITATITMSVLLIAGYVSGVAPMPEPIPKAIAAHLLGGSASTPILIGFALTAHLLYGGLFGALLAVSVRSVTLPKALGFGIGVWFIMQVIFLPFLGWGLFGTAITPKIAVATLVLHLVYGGVLGLTIDRNVTFARSSPVTG